MSASAGLSSRFPSGLWICVYGGSSSPKFLLKAICCSVESGVVAAEYQHRVAVHPFVDRRGFLRRKRQADIDAGTLGCEYGAQRLQGDVHLRGPRRVGSLAVAARAAQPNASAIA